MTDSRFALNPCTALHRLFILKELFRVRGAELNTPDLNFTDMRLLGELMPAEPIAVLAELRQCSMFVGRLSAVLVWDQMSVLTDLLPVDLCLAAQIMANRAHRLGPPTMSRFWSIGLEADEVVMAMFQVAQGAAMQLGTDARHCVRAALKFAPRSELIGAYSMHCPIPHVLWEIL